VDIKFDVSDITTTTITKVPYWTLPDTTAIQLTSSHAASLRTYIMQYPIHITLISERDVRNTHCRSGSCTEIIKCVVFND